MNSPFDELFGKAPTPEEVQQVFEEFDNQLGLNSGMESARRVTFQPWMILAATAILPNIAASLDMGQPAAEPIITGICMGILLGRRAVELEWDTSLIILDETISKAEMDAFEAIRAKMVDKMREDGE